MNIKKQTSLAVGLAMVAGTAVALPVFADTNLPAPAQHMMGERGEGRPGMMGEGREGMRPVVFGTVSAVNGTTITISGKQGFGASSTSTITYTVDASKAKVVKGKDTIQVSGIAVSDTLMIQGTVTGSNVVATMIKDGVPMAEGRGHDKDATSTPIFEGNGQPVVAGTITALNGSSISISNKSNVAYTVDATNAKIMKGKDTSTISGLVVGDSVVVQGAVNGSTITASTIIDQARPVNGSNGQGQQEGPRGFFGGIKNFFGRIFGF